MNISIKVILAILTVLIFSTSILAVDCECEDSQFCSNNICLDFSSCQDNEACPQGQHCAVDNICALDECSEDTPCLEGFVCRDDGLCIESPSDVDEDQCSDALPCDDGLVCQDGACVQDEDEQEEEGCKSNSDCEVNHHCIVDTGVCVESECTVTIPCDTGYTCTSNVCVKDQKEEGCKSNSDCEVNHHCIIDTGVCVESECTITIPCDTGYTCTNNVCVREGEGCLSNSDCEVNHHCIIDTGVCVESECTITIPCDTGYTCQDNICVEIGQDECLVDTDCRNVKNRCISKRCVPISTQAQCRLNSDCTESGHICDGAFQCVPSQTLTQFIIDLDTDISQRDHSILGYLKNAVHFTCQLINALDLSISNDGRQVTMHTTTNIADIDVSDESKCSVRLVSLAFIRSQISLNNNTTDDHDNDDINNTIASIDHNTNNTTDDDDFVTAQYSVVQVVSFRLKTTQVPSACVDTWSSTAQCSAQNVSCSSILCNIGTACNSDKQCQTNQCIDEVCTASDNSTLSSNVSLIISATTIILAIIAYLM